jgi:hypothetical protein
VEARRAAKARKAAAEAAFGELLGELREQGQLLHSTTLASMAAEVGLDERFSMMGPGTLAEKEVLLAAALKPLKQAEHRRVQQAKLNAGYSRRARALARYACLPACRQQWPAADTVALSQTAQLLLLLLCAVSICLTKADGREPVRD